MSWLLSDYHVSTMSSCLGINYSHLYDPQLMSCLVHMLEKVIVVNLLLYLAYISLPVALLRNLEFFEVIKHTFLTLHIELHTACILRDDSHAYLYKQFTQVDLPLVTHYVMVCMHAFMHRRIKMQYQRLSQEMQDLTIASFVKRTPKIKASRSLPAIGLKQTPRPRVSKSLHSSHYKCWDKLKTEVLFLLVSSFCSHQCLTISFPSQFPR